MLENRDRSVGGARRDTVPSAAPGVGGDADVLDASAAAVIDAFRASTGPMTPREVQTALNTHRAEPFSYRAISVTVERLTEQGLLGRWHDGSSVRYKLTTRRPNRPNPVDDIPGGEPEFVDSEQADPQLLHRLHRFLSDDDS